MNKLSVENKKGFTLIELMVTVGIFVLMTGVLLAKYGSFNQGIILTNLAYDVALNIRTAQSSGLNVKSTPANSSVNFSSQFNYPFGVHFTSGSSAFVNFADANYNNDTGIGRYESSEAISSVNIKRGSTVSSLCAGANENSCDNTILELDITFKRPDPVAHIVSVGTGDVVKSENGYAEITLRSVDGTTRKVVVRSTGQIAVK